MFYFVPKVCHVLIFFKNKKKNPDLCHNYLNMQPLKEIAVA